MDINQVTENIKQKIALKEKNRITQALIMTAASLIIDVNWTWVEKFFKGENNWILLIIGFTVFLICLCLTWLLTERSKIVLIISFLVILLSYLFIFNFTVKYLIVSIIVFILFLIATFQAIKEKDENLHISCFKIFKAGLPLIITGFALTLAAAFYGSSYAHPGPDIKIPRQIYNAFISPLIAPIKPQTVQPDGLKSAFLQANPEILEQFDIKLKGDESAEDIIYLLVNKQITKLLQPFQQYLPLILTIGFFSIVKTIGFILMYIIIFLSWMIFRILVSFGAIKINVQPVVQEIIEI